MKLLIRPAREDDLEAVLALYKTLDNRTSRAPLNRVAAAKIFRRMKRYPDYKIFVAVDHGKIIGTFSLLVMDNLTHAGAPSAIVESVAVAPNRQGEGIGKAMMGFAMRYCRKKGCYKLALSSHLKRRKAHAFYKALGFEQHGYSFKVRLR